MSTPDPVIVRVLGEHWANGWMCKCGWPLDDSVGSVTSHVAAALAAAGVGLIADAKAEAAQAVLDAVEQVVTPASAVDSVRAARTAAAKYGAGTLREQAIEQGICRLCGREVKGPWRDSDEWRTSGYCGTCLNGAADV